MPIKQASLQLFICYGFHMHPYNDPITPHPPVWALQSFYFCFHITVFDTLKPNAFILLLIHWKDAVQIKLHIRCWCNSTFQTHWRWKHKNPDVDCLPACVCRECLGRSKFIYNHRSAEWKSRWCWKSDVKRLNASLHIPFCNDNSSFYVPRKAGELHFQTNETAL